MTNVVAIVNQKGGVGKSTTAINLSAYLANLGEQVLVVDMDPQGNATSGLGVTVDDGSCMYDVLLEGKPMEQVAIPSEVEGLSIAPATINLVGAEVELVSALAREFKLKRAMDKLPDGLYDRVLIDCPPSLDLLTLNALTAADEVLIPMQCEYYALEGLAGLLDTLSLIQRELNPRLAVAGMILTMHDGRTRLAQEVEREVREHFPELVFDTVIPRNIRVGEAPSFGRPVIHHDPHSAGADAYFALAREVAARG